MNQKNTIDDTVGIIIGGGEGGRLHELTETRAKLMVPLAGSLKQISPTINNMDHSHIPMLFVLTQYEPASFSNYINHFWSHVWGRGPERFLQVIQAGKTRSEREDWFQGSADALRVTQKHWTKPNSKYLVLASVDHLYNMDYSALIDFAFETDADFVISYTSVPFAEGRDKGVLEIISDSKIKKIHEKKEVYPHLTGDETRCSVSMGIYAGKTEIIREVLNKHPEIDDIGGGLVPKLIKLGYNVQGYNYMQHKIKKLPEFQPFWMDIGTIEAYVEAHRILRESVPPMDILNPERSYREGAPSKIKDRNGITRSLIGGDAVVVNGNIEACTLGNRVQVDDGALLKEVIAFGLDPWEYHEPFTIFESGARLERVILDKCIRVPGWVDLNPGNPMGLNVRDGYVVVPKHYQFKR